MVVVAHYVTKFPFGQILAENHSVLWFCGSICHHHFHHQDSLMLCAPVGVLSR